MFGWFTKTRVKDRFTKDALELSDALYASALRFTGNSSEAEDLVQDAYTRAFRFRDKFEDGTNLKAWLFRILTNTYINKYRRDRREKEFMVRDYDFGEVESRFLDDWSRSDFGRHELPFTDGMSDEVQRAFMELPKNFRMVVELVDLQDFTYAEASRILDCPIGTVMSRLNRGRNLLKRSLSEYALWEGVIKEPSDDQDNGDNVKKLNDIRSAGRSST